MIYFYALMVALQHLAIPLILIILFIKLMSAHKKILFFLLFLLVFLTCASYFLGYFTSSKITFDTESIAQNYSENDNNDGYFCFTNENGYEYSGKVYCIKKSDFSSETVMKLVNNEELFQTKLNHISQNLLKQIKLHSSFYFDNYNVDLSPIVLSTNNFFLERNLYRGYALIESSDNILIIPYQVYFLDNLFNNISFMQIYSEKSEISINDIFDNLLSYEEYLESTIS